MPDIKQYANSYIDPSDNQRRYFKDLEATHEADASDPSTVLGGIKSTADNAETIAKGATRAMVFDTIAAMETWLKDAANKGKLKIGDNLYIKAVDVPDYWVSAVYETATPEGFYYNYSRLEVGTIKLSNVVTTDSDIVTSLDYFFGLRSGDPKRVSYNSLFDSLCLAILSPVYVGPAVTDIPSGWYSQYNSLYRFGNSKMYFIQYRIYGNSPVTPPRFYAGKVVIENYFSDFPFVSGTQSIPNSYGDAANFGFINSSGQIYIDFHTSAPTRVVAVCTLYWAS